MNFYLNILIESAYVSSIIPFGHEPTFFAMLGFGNYDMMLPVIIAVIGSAIGASFCFALGLFMKNIYFKTGQKHLSREKYQKASQIFSRFFMLLLPFTWIVLLNFLPLIAAFLGKRARIVLPLVILGKIGYYSFCVKTGKPI